MIKSEVKEESKVSRIAFPKLMKLKIDNKIVLFLNEHKGTVVSNNDPFGDHTGYYSEGWIIDYFEDFKGQVTLTNV